MGINNNTAIQRSSPLIRSGSTVTQRTPGDALVLLGANATTLSLGSASNEGGDLVIYRDGSSNTQVSIDADAASNAKAVDIYGGVVCQNYLTVGASTLWTGHQLYVSGYSKFTNKAYIFSINSSESNAASLPLDITVSGTDATDHEIKLQIDSNTIVGARATGDGAGGVTNLKCIMYAPFFLDGTPQTLTGAGAVNLTTSTTHVVTSSGPNALTLADGAEGQFKMIVMKTDDGDGVLTPTNLANGTTITFDDVGDSAFLFFTNSAWHFMGGTATLA